jgi:hypothetical protein
MKYIIAENRMVDLMGDFMKSLIPNFSRENVDVRRRIRTTGERYLTYNDKETDERFAKYHPYLKELQLEEELFDKLEGIFGDEMTAVIDWFNNEFDQDAESITF